VTTIAYKAGVLACDTQISAGMAYSYHVEKLVRVDARECWLVMCGCVNHFKDFLKWFAAQEAKPAEAPFEEDSFGAIVMFDDGRVEMYDEDLDFIDHPADKALAIGSGAAAALGAMYAGKSAAEAVHIASLIDPSTGGEVQSVARGEKPPKPRRKRVVAKPKSSPRRKRTQ
jgi:20S proteasome alpha/beta subunit